jgi:lipid-A-disaccharide synthase
MSLCLTTVGANTAELGSLAVPMIVLLPTQQLDAMRAWDGLLEF